MQTGLSNKPAREYRNENEQKCILGGKKIGCVWEIGKFNGYCCKESPMAKMGNGEQFNGQSGGNFEEHGKERGFRAGIIN